MVKAARKAGKKAIKDIKPNQKSAPESKYPPPEDEFGGGDLSRWNKTLKQMTTSRSSNAAENAIRITRQR